MSPLILLSLPPAGLLGHCCIQQAFNICSRVVSRRKNGDGNQLILTVSVANPPGAPGHPELTLPGPLCLLLPEPTVNEQTYKDKGRGDGNDGRGELRHPPVQEGEQETNFQAAEGKAGHTLTAARNLEAAAYRAAPARGLVSLELASSQGKLDREIF